MKGISKLRVLIRQELRQLIVNIDLRYDIFFRVVGQRKLSLGGDQYSLVDFNRCLEGFEGWVEYIDLEQRLVPLGKL